MFDLSFIIPVKAGDVSWKKLLESLITELHCEIILIGPDFQDSINGLLQYVHLNGNRAEKLNSGAIKARSSHLVFLHADSIPPAGFDKTIFNLLKKYPDDLHHFELQFDSTGLIQLNAYLANIRSNVFKMPFGDQAFYMTKRTFYYLGFYNMDVPYGEDHLLVWQAHQKNISVRSNGIKMVTSSRKYELNGWIKTSAQHIFLTCKQALPELIKKIKKKETISALAIFVKTPGYSQIKTRLALSIGKEKAEEFFKLSLEATEEYVLHALKESRGKIRAYWAVSEEEALQDPLWSNFPVISQGTGSLGEKLYHVHDLLMKKHDYVFMVGADSPQLPYKNLARAFMETENAKHIIGQTDDGGFYLYGGNVHLKKNFWTAINYSSESTAQELIKKIGPTKIVKLEKSFDIDTIYDLQKLANHPIEKLLPKQRVIVQWAKEMFRPV